MKAPGVPSVSSQSNATEKAESPVANGVVEVIHPSKYAGCPSFPFIWFPTQAMQKFSCEEESKIQSSPNREMKQQGKREGNNDVQRDRLRLAFITKQTHRILMAPLSL